MDEYINANSFKSALSILGNKMSENGKAVIDQVLELLNDYEKEDMAPVVHGEWILQQDEHFPDAFYMCSVCLYIHDAYLQRPGLFCPCCGAKMDLR